MLAKELRELLEGQLPEMEVRIADGLVMKQIDSVVFLKSSPVLVLCNDDWMKLGGSKE